MSAMFTIKPPFVNQRGLSTQKKALRATYREVSLPLCMKPTKTANGSVARAYTPKKEKFMKMGRSQIDRDRSSIRDIQKQIQKENAKKTPQELGMDEMFEDVPTRLSDRDKYGKVHKVSTSSLTHRRSGSTFDDQ
jgi:hypothetical protein